MTGRQSLLLLPVLLGLTAIGSEAKTKGGVACFNSAPINEAFRVMLGRDSTSAEAAHFANLIIQGEQFAYFEPYVVNDCGTTPTDAFCVQPLSCSSWVATAVDSSHAGIPYFIPDDWEKHGQGSGMFVTAIYRSLFGSMPQAPVLQRWVTEFQKLGDTAQSLPALAKEMQNQLPAGATGSWDGIDEIFDRVQGRKADHSHCTFKSETAPLAGSDCFWFWALANGKLPINDVIHGIRSTPQGIQANESALCYEQNPAQTDPHAIGEYVRQLYHLLLRRGPTGREMSDAIETYTGGDTTPLLRGAASKIMKSDEYKLVCASGSK